MPIDLQPPGADEIEISLFGPGTGESLVIHLGQGQWMIVDSCKLKGDPEPAPLKYLRRLGLDPNDCVSSVVVTHFHADHIRGMDTILDECGEANFWISSALCEDEAAAYVMAHADDAMITDRGMPGTKELGKVLKAVIAGEITARNAIESRVLYRSNGTIVTALSPSDPATNQAKLDFAAALESLEGGYKKLARKLTPNLCAVALHIETNVGVALLGADLEVSNSPELGWEAAVSSPQRPDTVATVYKVSHHGSENGHYEPVYEQMVADTPTQILTTFDGHSLPGPTDVHRICSYGGDVYCTTSPKVKPPKRDKVVESAMKAVVKSRKVVGVGLGHIQLRMTDQGLKVNTNELAEQLNAS